MYPGMRFILAVVIVGYITLGGLQFNAYRFETAGMAVNQMYESNNLAAAVGLSFQGTVTWVKSAGYVAMFIAMFLEGPIITAAAAFGAALGYFNIWIVLSLSIFADLAADLLYYAIGYFSRVAVIEKIGHCFGLSRERMKKLEGLIHTHPIKTLLFIKLAPALPTPGLMIVGTMRMPLRHYSTLSALIILPKVLLFAALGYYFGAAYDTIAHYAQAGEYFIIVAIAVTVAAYWMYQKGGEMLSVRLQTI